MSDKYYVPEISEFHVGFEFEEETTFHHKEQIEHTGEWHKQVVEDDPDVYLRQFIWDIENKSVRVKYLDQSDIEELGWSCWTDIPKESPIKREGEVAKKIDLTFNLGIWWLDFNADGSVQILGSTDEDNYDIKTPEMKIKNKSELSRLMKMIGII